MFSARSLYARTSVASSPVVATYAILHRSLINFADWLASMVFGCCCVKRTRAPQTAGQKAAMATTDHKRGGVVPWCVPQRTKIISMPIQNNPRQWPEEALDEIYIIRGRVRLSCVYVCLIFTSSRPRGGKRTGDNNTKGRLLLRHNYWQIHWWHNQPQRGPLPCHRRPIPVDTPRCTPPRHWTSSCHTQDIDTSGCSH